MTPINRRELLTVGAIMTVATSVTTANSATAATLPSLVPFFDIATSPYHVRTSKNDAYGAWADGPMNPYRDGSHTYFQLCHSENYRIRVTNADWGNRQGWTLEPTSIKPLFNSSRSAVESDYDNRHWIMSVWNDREELNCLSHHEWYPVRKTADVPAFGLKGVGGFNGGAWWVTGLGHIKRNSSGVWSLTSVAKDSSRLVIVPQPSRAQRITVAKKGSDVGLPPNAPFFGFGHPSNIVFEEPHFYAFATCISYVPNAKARRGSVLLRTSGIRSPLGWQMWAANQTWQTINHDYYQGNDGQMPWLFWEKRPDGGELAALNVRRHIPSGRWIVAGRDWHPQRPLVLSRLSSLASPQSLESETRTITFSNGSSLLPDYYSIFDPSGAYATQNDPNYTLIGDRPLIVATCAQTAYYHQFIDLPW